MYVVKIRVNEGDWVDVETLFVTAKKKTAVEYVKKFNKVIEEAKKFYTEKAMSTTGDGGHPIVEYTKEETLWWNKYFKFQSLDRCYYEPIKVR